MTALFETCGYIASFLGTFIEGEILLLTSVMSSKLGYINYFGGMSAAFLGAFLKDSIKFIMVKRYGSKLLNNKPKLQAKLERTSTWYDKSPFFYMTFYRVMYGFGTPILMLSGLKGVPYMRFAIHSAISILIWISLIGGLGYFCTEIMIERLNFLKNHAIELISLLAVIGLTYWFFFKRPYDHYCFRPLIKNE